MLTNLYYTLIYPYLSYGLMSWGTTYKSKLNQLSSKLNKCVKCIFFANRRENPSPYYKLLGILKLDNLIKFKTATFMSQIGNETPELSIIQGMHPKIITIGQLLEQTLANFHLSFLLLNYGRVYPFSLNHSLVILSKRNIKTFYFIIRNNLLLQISSTLSRIFIY